MAILAGVWWYAYRPLKSAPYLIAVHIGLALSCISILILFPADLGGAMQTMCMDTGCQVPSFIPCIPQSWLFWMWRLFYWYTFLSTWAFLPFLTSFVTSGQWTIKQRAKQAFWDNILFYGVYLVVGIGFVLIYLWRHQDPTFSFWSWLMAFGYAFGLFLVVAFLGYGLVELPRSCYRHARRHPDCRGNQIYWDTFSYVSLLKDAIDDLDARMSQIRQRVLALKSLIPHQSVCNDRAVQLCHEIERDIHINHRSYHHRLYHPTSDYPFSDTEESPGVDRQRSISPLYAMPELVRLRENWMECQRCFVRYDGEWIQMVNAGSQLLDDEMDRLEGIMPISRKIWLALERWVYLFCAGLFGFLSFTILWSELAMMLHTYIRDLKYLQSFALAFWIKDWIHSGQLTVAMSISFFALFYMILCIWVALSRFNFFQRYQLVSRHHTDLPSLLFLTSYACRLIFPLCYHYLGLIDTRPPYQDENLYELNAISTSFSKETSFVKVMGSINLVPFLGPNYYLFLPIFVVIVCVIVLFRVDARLISWFGLHPFFESFIPRVQLDPTNRDRDHGSTSMTLLPTTQSLLTENMERGKRLVRQSRSLMRHSTSLLYG